MNKQDLINAGLTKEALEKAGLTEDVLQQIIVLHGKDIEKHKGDVTQATTELEKVQGQLTQANKQIADFQGQDIETIKRNAEEWKTKAGNFENELKTAREDAQKQVAEMTFNTNLANALKSAGVKDSKEVLPHLKMETITWDSEKSAFVGLDDQLTPLKESKGYLFDDGDPDIKIVSTTTNSKSTVSDKTLVSAREAAGLPTK